METVSGSVMDIHWGFFFLSISINVVIVMILFILSVIDGVPRNETL